MEVINVYTLSLDVRENLGSTVQNLLLQYNTICFKKISIYVRTYAHCQYIAIFRLQKSPLIARMVFNPVNTE